MSTKDFNQAAGVEAGRTLGERHINDDFVRMTSENARKIAQAQASNASAEAKIRSSVWHDAFVAAFMAVYTERRNALPEVKAANRVRRIGWLIEDLRSGAEEKLANFKRDLSVNPRFAFEGADGAIDAAARLDVAAHLQGIFDAADKPKGGPEAAVAYATDQALRGARYGHHSTSACSNATAMAMTAAFAEFASRAAEGL